MRPGPQVTFTTDFFKPIAGEEEETNPGRYGKALAQWLAAKLKERGVSVDSINPEDFGWMVIISRKPFLVWIGCGNTDESTTQWSVFPAAEMSALQFIFKRKYSMLEVERLTDHLLTIVPSIPRVKNIFWE